jgi:hypothetical protein
MLDLVYQQGIPLEDTEFILAYVRVLWRIGHKSAFRQPACELMIGWTVDLGIGEDEGNGPFAGGKSALDRGEPAEERQPA